MSKEGIQIFANVMSTMQEARIRLLGLHNEKGEVDTNNILLGQLLDTAKDVIKDRFSEITLMENFNPIGRSS